MPCEEYKSQEKWEYDAPYDYCNFAHGAVPGFVHVALYGSTTRTRGSVLMYYRLTERTLYFILLHGFGYDRTALRTRDRRIGNLRSAFFAFD